MNCAEVRESLAAAPRERSPELIAHLATCAGCAAYAAELELFEAKLHRALAVPVPARAPPTLAALQAGGAGPNVVGIAARRARRMPVWIALAAGGAFAAVLVALLLSVYPRQALATALVRHVEGEPDSWSANAPVPEGALAYVLKQTGVRLGPDGPPVTYAQSCTFRGRSVPHLVVQTAAGPMTVMVLRYEHVSRTMTFDESGFHGVIVPAGRGAVAVLARGAGESAVSEDVARQAARTIQFVD
jgi:Protein of unknown function (DUF3379)